jgi:hypothetical protein
MSRKDEDHSQAEPRLLRGLGSTALITILIRCTALPDSISNLRSQAEACLLSAALPSHCPLLSALIPQLQYTSRAFRCDETSLSIVVRRECYGVTRELPSGLWLGVT